MTGFEMNTLNMAQQGVFGEVLRAQGAYIHNLDDFWPYYWKNGKEDKLDGACVTTRKTVATYTLLTALAL